MKKVFSSIIYAAFLVPATLGTIIIIAFIERYIGLSTFILPGFLETVFAITILGTSLFWLANKIINNLEKLRKPRLNDHFRQTILCYLVGIIGMITFLIKGYHNGLGEAYFFMASIISTVGIIINALFLYRQQKLNLH